MPDASDRLERWRQDYNTARPHSALGNLTPRAFARQAHEARTIAEKLDELRGRSKSQTFYPHGEPTMRIQSFLILFCVLFTYMLFTDVASAKSGTIKQDLAFGCITEEALDEFTGAAIDKDTKQMKALLRSLQCFSITGRQYSTIDVGILTSKIRVYAGGGSVVLFVHTSVLS